MSSDISALGRSTLLDEIGQVVGITAVPAEDKHLNMIVYFIGGAKYVFAIGELPGPPDMNELRPWLGQWVPGRDFYTQARSMIMGPYQDVMEVNNSTADFLNKHLSDEYHWEWLPEDQVGVKKT